MSSVQYMREFINERLTAAAEEIFGVLEKTIVEYEEEIDRQRRLLDDVWKPEIKLHRIELPQPHVYTEKEDQQRCNQERSSSMDQEDPEPPGIKEEQEELCTSQEEEQLVLKQETDTFKLTLTCEESDHSEPETKSDHRLLFHHSNEAENQDQKGDKHKDSGSTRDTEPNQQQRHVESNINTMYNSTMSNSNCITHGSKKSFTCDTCGKAFKHKSSMDMHLRIHTGEKPYPCNTCGKRFSRMQDLNRHMRIHTGEKPYTCETCGKGFLLNCLVKNHMKMHTGEKPYPCNTCGKKFSRMPDLKRHIRIHTGEKPYTCETCGRAFRYRGDLIVHMRRAHTGEKPYLCNTCGKRYFDASQLAKHATLHSVK